MNKQIKERGIIFNGEMVRAILDGRKTQTRRVIKNQPFDRSWSRHDHHIEIVSGRADEGDEIDGLHAYTKSSGGVWSAKCPFGQVGDRLWVRETWSDVNYEGYPSLAYRADGELKALNEDDGDDSDPNFEKYQFANWYPDLIEGAEGRWRPSIHMPRWASRITLEITDIRVERLRDINECGSRAEGCKDKKPWTGLDGLIGSGGYTAREKFEEIWESIYGQDSWQYNPFVWVIEFKRVE